MVARRFGRSGIRMITGMLRAEGWLVNHKRVERIWRQEGLKVPMKHPERGGIRVELAQSLRTVRSSDHLTPFSSARPTRRWTPVEQGGRKSGSPGMCGVDLKWPPNIIEAQEQPMENAFVAVLAAAVGLVLLAVVWGTGFGFKLILFGCLILGAGALLLGDEKPDW